MLRRNASAYGPRVAITSEGGVDITYAELEHATNSLANALVGAGLRPGQRLVWLDRNSADFLIAYYATAKAGMTFTALNAWLRARELAPQLELLGPSVVVAGASFTEAIDRAAAGIAIPHRFVRDGLGRRRPGPPGRRGRSSPRPAIRIGRLRSTTTRTGCTRSSLPAAPPGRRRG